MIKDKQSETINYYLNWDDQDLLKFNSVYNYFDADKLHTDINNHTAENQDSDKIYDEIFEEVFDATLEDDLDVEELQKVKKEVFSELVCSNLLDILQSYLDGSDKANKNIAKEYIKEIAPGYVEKPIENQNHNMNKDTKELIKMFKKRNERMNS